MTPNYIIHNFIWGVDTPYVAEKEIFFRSPQNIIIQNDMILLDAFSYISFNTYYNIFPSKQISKYTNIKDLNIKISTIGKVKVEIYGVKKEFSHSYEKILLSFFSSGDANFNIQNWSIYDIIYCRVSSCEKYVTLKQIFLYTNDKPSQDILLGCCFCTHNREEYITNNINKIYNGINNSKINSKIFISNNGKEINIKNNNIISIENSSNYGGAGGFTRAALMASENQCSHIIFMDDDIELNFESIFRVYIFYSYIKNNYKHIFISGSMFSLDERWLQYERNTIIDNNGMHHQGNFQDLRCYNEMLENATCNLISGVAGWWFCAFSTQHLKDYGLPLPIFIRGDDIEFSKRCNAKILSLPGICVWHEPFYKKYSEIMEDYYLLRNILIFSFSSPEKLIRFGMNFFKKKVIKNITTWNYIALLMNKLAIEDFLSGKYRDNAYDNHQRIINIYNKSKIKNNIEGFNYHHNKYTHLQLRKKILIFLLSFIVCPFGQGVSQKGFDRRPSDFLGKKEVIVYDYQQQTGQKYLFNRRLLIFYFLFFLKKYFLIYKNQNKYREKIILYKNKVTTYKYWNNLFNRKL